LRTVGIDLATQDKNTATCVIDWSGSHPRVQAPTVGHDDDELLDAIDGCDRAGIDAPFGWPQAFAEAVAAHQAGQDWPGGHENLRAMAADRAHYRRNLAYRVTDLALIDDPDLTVRPLSVSTDRIGVTTFRCALVLDRLRRERRVQVDRSGQEGRVAEVYPAAALNRWRMTHKGYKRATGRTARSELVDRLARELGPGFGNAARQACIASDHGLDALIAAIVARAVAAGKTRGPGPDELAPAQTEGWIHVPACAVSELKRSYC
jgi:predicted nuclease with RNAse H fold